jgi:hypothetical protein
MQYSIFSRMLQLEDHYSSAPHHRRFKRTITTGLGGVGFKLTVLGGAITVGSRTGGDGGITAGSRTVGDECENCL